MYNFVTGAYKFIGAEAERRKIEEKVEVEVEVVGVEVVVCQLKVEHETKLFQARRDVNFVVGGELVNTKLY